MAYININMMQLLTYSNTLDDFYRIRAYFVQLTNFAPKIYILKPNIRYRNNNQSLLHLKMTFFVTINDW